jgi:hypothetical protein
MENVITKESSYGTMEKYLKVIGKMELKMAMVYGHPQKVIHIKVYGN